MQPKINISIDDVSPHPLSSLKVVDSCNKILEEFPDAKFTFFLPVAYWRTMSPGTSTPQPLNLSCYPEFCDQLKNLPIENFEFGLHGYYHGIPGKSNNDEFKSTTYEETLDILMAIQREINQADLVQVFKPIFRPPAWRMSPAAIKACADFGIKILALSNISYAKESYCGEDEKFPNVVYETCCPPFSPLRLSDLTEIVYHACSWDSNFLSDEQVKTLLDFLKENKGKFEFSFLEEMCSKK